MAPTTSAFSCIRHVDGSFWQGLLQASIRLTTGSGWNGKRAMSRRGGRNIILVTQGLLCARTASISTWPKVVLEVSLSCWQVSLPPLARSTPRHDSRRDLLVRSAWRDPVVGSAFRRDALVASDARHWIIHFTSSGMTGMPLQAGTTSVPLRILLRRDLLIMSAHNCCETNVLGARRVGQMTENRAPPSRRFSTQIRPPWARTISRQMARPKPVPPAEVLVRDDW